MQILDGTEQSKRLSITDQRLLLFTGRSTLPPYCLKCGCSATHYPSQDIVWYPRFPEFLLLFVGVVLYRRVTVDLPLCTKHIWHRRMGNLCGALLLIGAIPVGIAIGAQSFSSAATLGFIAFLLFVIFGVRTLWRNEILHIKRIDKDGFVLLKGASDDFFNAIQMGSPMYPESHVGD
jgi:hypothetical protein